MDDQRGDKSSQAPPSEKDTGWEHSNTEVVRSTPDTLWGCGECKKSERGRFKRRILVVCFDGTDNQFGEKIIRDEDQLPYYASGIGTYARNSRKSWKYWVAAIDNAVDKAIAWNFERVLLGGYRFLVDHFKPGYRIFIFGFSRGAYQARTLAAMISKVGLLEKGNHHQIPYAYEVYCNIPQTSKGKDIGDGEVAEAFKRGNGQKGARVHYLGLWDTVSSVGFFRGRTLPGTDIISEHACIVRHAMALDERRVKFLPEYVIFKEINPKNGDEPRVKEVWFAGCHSDIGGGTQRNVTLDRISPSYVWMKNESRLHGLRMREAASEGSLDQDSFNQFKKKESLTGLWHIIEYIPIPWLLHGVKTFESPEVKWAPHRGLGRVVLPHQTIHSSVCLGQGGYKPKAVMARGRRWDDFLGHSLDDLAWVDDLGSQLEIDLIDLSLVGKVVEEAIIYDNRGSGVSGVDSLTCLRFLLRSKFGTECILSHLEQSTSELLRGYRSSTLKLFSNLILGGLVLSRRVDDLIWTIVDSVVEAFEDEGMHIDALTSIARTYGRLPLPFLYSGDPSIPWYAGFAENKSSGPPRKICLASILYGRFQQQSRRDDLEMAYNYFPPSFTEWGLDDANPITRHLQNSVASINEAQAIVGKGNTIEDIRRVIKQRRDLEEQYGGFRSDIANSCINLSKLLLEGRGVPRLQFPNYVGPTDTLTSDLHLSMALATLAEHHYSYLKRDTLTAALESVTISGILTDAIEAVNLSPSTTRSRSKALNVISNCHCDDGDFEIALAMAEGAVKNNRMLGDQPLDLAVSLVTRSRCLLGLQRGKTALGDSTEAVNILRGLTELGEGADEVKDHLLASLEARANALESLGRVALLERREAFELWIKKMETFRFIEEYDSTFADTLTAFFRSLCSLGEYDNARREAERVEVIRGDLIRGPQGSTLRSRPILPFSVLSSELSSSCRLEEAIAIAKRAVEMARYEEDIALSKLCLSRCYSDIGRHSDAQDTIYESMEIYHPLSNLKAGWALKADLTYSFQRLSESLWKCGRTKDACTMAFKGIRSYGELLVEAIPPDVDTLRLITSFLVRRSISNGIEGDATLMINDVLKLYLTAARQYPAVYAASGIDSLILLLSHLQSDESSVEVIHRIEEGMVELESLRRGAARRDHVGHVVSLEPQDPSNTSSARIECLVYNAFKLLRQNPHDDIHYGNLTTLAQTREGARAILKQSAALNALCERIPMKGKLIWPILSQVAVHDPNCDLIGLPSLVDTIEKILQDDETSDKDTILTLNDFANIYGGLPMSVFNRPRALTEGLADTEHPHPSPKWLLTTAVATLSFTSYLLHYKRQDLIKAQTWFSWAAGMVPGQGLTESDIQSCRATLIEAEGTQTALHQAVQLRIRLDEQFPGGIYHFDLVNSALNLATCRVNRLRRQKYDISRNITTQFKRRRLSNDAQEYTKCLTSLSMAIQEIGLTEDAFRVAEQSVSSFRERSYEPGATDASVGMAIAMGNLGKRLCDRGRYGDAVSASMDAVRIWRDLLHSRCETHEESFVFPMGTIDTTQIEFNNLYDSLSSDLHTLSIAWRVLGSREKAFIHVREAVGIRKSRQVDQELPDPSFASCLVTLSDCLLDLGRYQEACNPASEAVRLLEILAEDQPSLFTSHLALALCTLSRCHHDVGLDDEAWECARKAVELTRGLPKDQPLMLPRSSELAFSLIALSSSHRDLGHYLEAWDAAQEAVGLFRVLAHDQPFLYNRHLASSLSNSSNCHRAVGLYDEALRDAQDAVDLIRSLANDQPSMFDPQLASSLHILSNCHRNLGHDDDALSTAQDAVTLLNDLYQKRPLAFRPYLASTLNNLSKCHHNLGYYDEAFKTSQASVALFKDLAADRPVVFDPHLASSFNTLSNSHRSLGQYHQAMNVARQAVGLLETVKRDTLVFDPQLVSSLVTLSKCHLDLGRYDEALHFAQSSVNLSRNLVKDRPLVFKSRLAESLGVLSKCYHHLGVHDEAMGAAQEAVVICKELAGDRPLLFEPHFAKSLGTLSLCYHKLGHYLGAFSSSQDAVSRFRNLAETRPSVYNVHLVTTLRSLSNCHRDLGRHDEALNAVEEAVGLCKSPSQGRPLVFKPLLASSLAAFSNCCHLMGLYDKALSAAQDAVVLLKILVEDRPIVFNPQLALLLITLSNCHRDLGHNGDALRFAQDALTLSRNLAEPRPLVYDSQTATSPSAEYRAVVPDAGLLRSIEEDHIIKFDPLLALSLNTISGCHHNLEQYDEVSIFAEEAIASFKSITADDQWHAFYPHLAHSLSILSICHSRLGKYHDAVNAAREAIDLFRHLKKESPWRMFTPELALSLGYLSGCLEDLTDPNKAPNLSESLTQDQQLKPDLALWFIILSHMYRRHGRHEEAADHARNSLALYGQVADERPDLHQPIIEGWEHLIECLSNLGREEEVEEAKFELEQFSQEKSEGEIGTEELFGASGVPGLTM